MKKEIIGLLGGLALFGFATSPYVSDGPHGSHGSLAKETSWKEWTDEDLKRELHDFYELLKYREPAMSKYYNERIFNRGLYRFYYIAKYALHYKELDKKQGKMCSKIDHMKTFKLRSFETILKNFLPEVMSFKGLSGFANKSDSGNNESSYSLGPFTIHNTTKASAEVLNETNRTINEFINKVNGSNFPLLKKCLYGDIYLVNSVAGNAAGLYKIGDDIINLRVFRKADLKRLGRTNKNYVKTLIHELTHRMWYQFMDRDTQGDVRRWYFDILRNDKEPVNIDWEVQGYPLDIKVSGFGRERPQFHSFSSTGNIKVFSHWNNPVELNLKSRDLNRILRSGMATGGFPTGYAKTNEEEFLAEVVSFAILDSLRPDISKRLYEILL